jgi:hypothetical protein
MQCCEDHSKLLPPQLKRVGGRVAGGGEDWGVRKGVEWQDLSTKRSS